jgi:hypothetical protein
LYNLKGTKKPRLLDDYMHIYLHNEISIHHKQLITKVVQDFQFDLINLQANIDEINTRRIKPFNKINPKYLEISVSV